MAVFMLQGASIGCNLSKGSTVERRGMFFFGSQFVVFFVLNGLPHGLPDIRFCTETVLCIESDAQAFSSFFLPYQPLFLFQFSHKWTFLFQGIEPTCFGSEQEHNESKNHRDAKESKPKIPAERKLPTS
ncbi:uncharacterized protein A4U43_C04F25990 [Asparagus officinalis]|uniref:Uncharacterized protein n=1 Tax=Asparagus officinalis TaxID=4686 RepID=A0A5P1F910_ASPOF|nr:uncharacterized protein A4U43_C04F25990 [Asparagus officinalis]